VVETFPQGRDFISTRWRHFLKAGISSPRGGDISLNPGFHLHAVETFPQGRGFISTRWRRFPKAGVSSPRGGDISPNPGFYLHAVGTLSPSGLFFSGRWSGFSNIKNKKPPRISPERPPLINASTRDGH